jgi:hypothetical protein
VKCFQAHAIIARDGDLNHWKSLVIIAILLGGCAAQQQRVEQERKMVTQFDESQVMVVTGDHDQSYKILGQINYTDPVSGEAIDTNHINARLRRMAIDRYQDQVDAIIHIASTTNSSDRFEVSGEAVEIKGPCSFCRHKELVEVANDETNGPIAGPGGDLAGVWIGNFTVGCVPPLASPPVSAARTSALPSFSMTARLPGFTSARLVTIPASVSSMGAIGGHCGRLLVDRELGW